MGLTRGRVVDARGAAPVAAGERAPGAVVVPRVVLEARESAEAIVDGARAEAKRVVELAQQEAAGLRARAEREGVRDGEAKVAASLLRARGLEAEAREARLDDVIEVGRALAERLLGHALSQDPAVVVSLAREALSTLTRARRVRLVASPDDAPTLEANLASLGLPLASFEVQIDPSLSRGSLRAHTDLGLLDADVSLSLDRLADALRSR